MNESQFSEHIAKIYSLTEKQVSHTISLLASGNTIPFIARYRKELTQNLDEIQIGEIRDTLLRLKETEKRREYILQSIESQGKLTDTLKQSILHADNLTQLEDLYLPYKPKQRTKATVAREKGLEPLAKMLLSHNIEDLEKATQPFIIRSKEITTSEEALQGARDIIAEWVSENIYIRSQLRRMYRENGVIKSKVVKKELEASSDDVGDQQNNSSKVEKRSVLTSSSSSKSTIHNYERYFDYNEPIHRTPSHRILALFRGENEGYLRLSIAVDQQEVIEIINKIFIKPHHTTSQVSEAIIDAYKRMLHPAMDTEMRNFLKEKADKKAIEIFANNVRQLLLAPPLGGKRVLAIDPGFKSGCKVVCLDSSGNLLYNETIFPLPPQKEIAKATKKIIQLTDAYQIEAIAIGNGTGGRETEQFIQKIRFPGKIIAVSVNESGASVYSASKIAREEFPDYDITVRGAVSIGRRLMDPLAELVKIDPKSIGVGQYQHDVNQTALSQALTDTVEWCVNKVGVNVNTASKELLTYVSGIGPTTAEKIVEFRTENRGIYSRNDLKKISRFGDKTFQQAAGFLRIPESDNILDNTAVHPESYSVVKKMAMSINATIKDLILDKTLLKKIDLSTFLDDKIGLPTLNDIIAELEKPGRDPRKEIEFCQFNQEIHKIEQLEIGMVLQGIITNITAFGAFVDIGVHQDGLIHISQLANAFVSDPNEIVHINQPVRVRVLSIDLSQKRIQLSMKEL